MQILFYVCFGVGVGYTLLTFLLGEVLGAIDLGLDIDLDFNVDMDVDFDFGGGSVSPVKPVAIAAFLTVFGAVGILLLGKLHVLAVFILAAFGGLAAGYGMMRFVIWPLQRAQNTSAVDQASLIGADAMVIDAIPQGAYGRISYHAAGNTYSAPAKAEGGGGIPREAAVEIMYIEQNTYYVREKLPLTQDEQKRRLPEWDYKQQ